MKFWDSSAILPLCVNEPTSPVLRKTLKADQAMVVWWATRIECTSALLRQAREEMLTPKGTDQARAVLKQLADTWTEIHPTPVVREHAERLLSVHPLRTADALQLAAALTWSGHLPKNHYLVCLDHRLRDSAKKEGFSLLPAEF
ncbi:MAG TPA: type II toxin-antitoxin system VapC family toxin [Nitrospiria bacterium]